MQLTRKFATIAGSTALVAVALAATPAAADDRPRPSLPVIRVDKQCASGHNPHCHPVWVSVLVGADLYRPVGVWIRFTRGSEGK